MTRVEDDISQALSEEAEQASVADSLVAGLLRQRREPRRMPARSSALAVSAVVAVVLGLLSLPVLQREPVTTPAASVESQATNQAGALSSIAPGYIDLHENGVHVALDQRGASGLDPWRSWQLPCKESLLAPARSHLLRKAACAGQRGHYPMWEVLVAPDWYDVTLGPRHFRWLTPVSRSAASIGLPLTEMAVSERTAFLTTVSGMASYPCSTDRRADRLNVAVRPHVPCRNHGWVHRVWTTISFPDHGVQVSILAADRAAIAWLTSTIYIS